MTTITGEPADASNTAKKWLSFNGQTSTIGNGYTDITIDTQLTVFNTKNIQASI